MIFHKVLCITIKCIIIKYTLGFLSILCKFTQKKIINHYKNHFLISKKLVTSALTLSSFTESSQS